MAGPGLDHPSADEGDRRDRGDRGGRHSRPAPTEPPAPAAPSKADVHPGRWCLRARQLLKPRAEGFLAHDQIPLRRAGWKVLGWLLAGWLLAGCRPPDAHGPGPGWQCAPGAESSAGSSAAPPSAGSSALRSAIRPLAVWLFTVPAEQPRTLAV